jgi:putative acetyltransferase
MEKIEIIDYEDRYQPVFKALNAEWLYKYNLMEDLDMETLNHPDRMIIGAGGVIYLARFEDQIIGSAALIPEHHGVYELAKMAVAEEFRNRGISRMLIERCLEMAKTLGASKVTLFSNHQLKAALTLYEKYGFQYVPVEDSPFATADVKMELKL